MAAYGLAPNTDWLTAIRISPASTLMTDAHPEFGICGIGWD